MSDTDLPAFRTDTIEDLFDVNAQFEGCPVRPRLARSNYGVEILAHDLVRAGFLDKRMRPRSVEYYQKLGASPLILEFIDNGNLNFMEADKHDRIRNAINKAFRPERVEEFRPEMRRIARGLIDQFIARGEADLVEEFCHMYPISAFAQFMGVPEKDAPDFAEATVKTRLLGQVPFAPGIPALEGALRYLYDYVINLIAQRRANPEDGFFDALIRLPDEGEAISEAELVWGTVFLLMGGHDTTRFTLSNCFHTLIDRGLWDHAAANPADIPNMIRESMRYCTGTPRQMRIVTEAYDLEGHRFEVGDVVALSLNAAGHDPETFAEEDSYQFDRSPSYRLGFGFGRHFCLGQNFATVEMEEAVAELTKAIRDVEVSGECRIKPTGVICGYDSLPVRFKVRA